MAWVSSWMFRIRQDMEFHETTIGVALDCYDAAKKYSLERHQFDKPIASFSTNSKKISRNAYRNYKSAAFMLEIRITYG